MHGEMPGNPPGRPGGEHDEPLLDMMLERCPIPPGAPREAHDLARMLAAAVGPAEFGELDGEAAALAAFTRLASPPRTSHAARPPARRWRSGRPSRGKLPLAAALVVAAGLGSTAAAYADVLPAPIQHFAHKTIGAPDSPGPGPQQKNAAVLPRPSKRLQPDPSAGQKPHSAPATAARGTVGSPARPAGLPRRTVRPTRAACPSAPFPGYITLKPRPTGTALGRGTALIPWPIRSPWPTASPVKPACATPVARAATVRPASPKPSL